MRLSPRFDRPSALSAREMAVISSLLLLAARISWTGPWWAASSSGGPPGGGPVGALQVRPGRLVDSAARDQDEVSGRATHRPPIHLAQKTLGPGPLDGPANLPARHHSEARRPTSGGARQADRYEVRGNTTRSGGHHLTELRGPGNPLGPRKRLNPAGACGLRATTPGAMLTHDDLSSAARCRSRACGVPEIARHLTGHPSRLNRAARRRSSLRFGRNTPGIPPPRALSAGRLASLGARGTSSTGG